MTVSHSLGSTSHTVQVGQDGARRVRLYELLRLLSRDWHNAEWMIDNSPLSLKETLTSERFIKWLRSTAGDAATAAAQRFDHQSREHRQVLALLVRCYRLDKRTPRWAANFWR